MVTARDIRVGADRTVRAYDSGAPDSDTGGLVVMWHHGTPQTGALLRPLLRAAADRNIRLVSFGRPSYGGSSPAAGRDVAHVAGLAAIVADGFGVERFATMGASGGGPHALACAALLGERVLAVVTLAGLAPYADDVDWFAGMRSPGGLRTALVSRTARARYAETAEFDEQMFTVADHAALNHRWQALGADAAHAGLDGPDGAIDDDLAYVHPWGFAVGGIEAPVLVVQGGQDRIVPPTHADWLVRHLRRPEYWLRPHDGHISVLDACPVAMDWLLANAG